MKDFKYEIECAIQEITTNVELLYQQKKPDAMEKFNVVLTDMQNIIEILLQAQLGAIKIDESLIQDLFYQIISAMEEKDYVLVADLILYEFIAYINEVIS